MTRMKTIFLAAAIITAALFLGAAQTPPQPATPATPSMHAAPAMRVDPAPVPVPAAPPEPPMFDNYGEEGGSYLGIDTQDVTPQRVAALKLKEERGVEVLTVDQDAPAGKAGLKEHDVILEFNGEKVQGVEQLRRMIRETPSGRSAKLLISRDGALKTVDVQLADRTQAFAHSNKHIHVRMPVPPVVPDLSDLPAFDVMVQTGGTRSGVSVENLTPQLGQFFGVKDGDGVLVRSVNKGTPAEAAGLRAGDVIIKVNNERVTDIGDWRTAMRGHRGGKMTIGIIRDRKEQTLSITMPERKDESYVWPGFDVDDETIAWVSPEVQDKLAEMLPKVKKSGKLSKQQQKELEQKMEELQQKMRKLQHDFDFDFDFGVDPDMD